MPAMWWGVMLMPCSCHACESPYSTRTSTSTNSCAKPLTQSSDRTAGVEEEPVAYEKEPSAARSLTEYEPLTWYSMQLMAWPAGATRLPYTHTSRLKLRCIQCSCNGIEKPWLQPRPWREDVCYPGIHGTGNLWTPRILYPGTPIRSKTYILFLYVYYVCMLIFHQLHPWRHQLYSSLLLTKHRNSDALPQVGNTNQ